METKQIKFRVWPESDDPYGDTYGGILVDNKFVICGCCGGVFGVEEVEIVEVYKTWLNISDEIKGDE